MRICFVNDYFLKDRSAAITGPMVQTYLLATGLARRGWTVEYVATTHSEPAGTTETHEGVTVHYVRAGRFFEVGSACAVAKKLRSIQADVFYQRGRSTLTGITARAARRCGAKFIWASSGESGVRRAKYVGERLAKKRGWRRFVLRPLYAWADRLYESGIEQADTVLVQTDRQREALKLAFGRDSIVFKSGHPVPPESALEKPQPPVVLWLGSVKPAKQPQLFLDLAVRCADLNGRFLLVGRMEDAGWRSRLSEVASQNSKFSFRDEVPFDEASALVAEASVLVNTTVPDYEGLPNVFIQAWLHGVPVVSLHADPDRVLEREQIGFRADTFEKLVEHTSFLLTHSAEREAMGRQARSYAEREFGMERILTQFEEIAVKTGLPHRARI
jgi:glycosyltransferase involved in cell wall biosynthesis